jgi:PleD family two-component response regulator
MPQQLRRVLTIADRNRLSHLESALDGWEIVRAASVAEACFHLEGQACDVAILDAQLAGSDWVQDLDWLRAHVASPLIVLGDQYYQAVVLPALEREAIWLPLSAVTICPSLLACVLEQAWQRQRRYREAERLARQFHETHAQVDRLLDMLWQATPGQSIGPWFTQRYMTSRLGEEIARRQRHGGLLCVVLGELRDVTGRPFDGVLLNPLNDWLASRISVSKRRCDVAGQYGTNGFMLLLPQASREEARGACRRLGRVLADPPEGLPRVRPCFGLAGLPGDPASVSGLLSRAEERLMQACQLPANEWRLGETCDSLVGVSG